MRDKKAQKISEIFKHFYYDAPLSVADLGQRLDKSLPNTTAQINELLQKGFIVETGQAPSTGGRKPQVYGLKPDLFYILSIALDQFVARVAIMDLNNRFLTTPAKYDLNLMNNPEVLDKLAAIIDDYIIVSGIDKTLIAGIGIGMPGFVDITKGVNHSISDTRSITQVLTESTGIPVFIDNDSSSIALAELKFGIAKKPANVMVLNIGWGVGLGLILDHRIFRGSDGFAGEFSHIPLFANNKLCSCGKSGCLETESSLYVIVNKAIDGLKNGRVSRIALSDLDPNQMERSFDLIKDAALKGDKFAVELFSSAAYEIGRGLAILIHLLNPDMVVLSGRGAQAGKIWLPPIQQALNDHCIPRLFENFEIRLSTMGFDAELIGAAALVIERAEHLQWRQYLDYVQ